MKTRDAALREVTREFKCSKCKNTMLFHANRFKRFLFEISEKCVQKGCTGNLHNTEDPEQSEANFQHFIDYQEASIQIFNNSEPLTIELDKELVYSCTVGDQVIVVGTFEERYKPGELDDIKVALRAVSVSISESQQKLNVDSNDLSCFLKIDWSNDLTRPGYDELKLRDEMVASVAPEIKGLSLIKLGMLLVLCSGGKSNSDSQIPASAVQRDIAHFLMIGNPGLGKSQLLRAASKISTNAYSAVGYSTTAAGLTARCYKEDGDMHVEAGSLVKANNGICCIDEINLMSKDHRSAVHEVMESQKITIMKGEKKKNCLML